MAGPESLTAFPPEGAQGCGARHAWAGDSPGQRVWGRGRGPHRCGPGLCPVHSLTNLSSSRTQWSRATGSALVHSIRVSARWKVLWRLRANHTQTATGPRPRPELGSQALRRKAGGRGVPRVGRALSNFSSENMQDWPPARD